jgi:hypothetical protein
VTGLCGQVLQLNGKPLADVTLRVRDTVAVTNRTGYFVLKDIPAGRQVLRIEGSTADRPGKAYGDFEAIVDIFAGFTMILPYRSGCRFSIPPMPFRFLPPPGRR